MKPAPLFIFCLIAWIGLGIVVSILPEMQAIWWLCGGALTLIGIFDALAVWSHPKLQFERELPQALPIYVKCSVKLHIENVSQRHYQLRVQDHYPHQCQSKTPPLSIELSPNQAIIANYDIVPQERGDGIFNGCDVAIRSAFGLWIRKWHIAKQSQVKIYPNFNSLVKYALFAADNHLNQLGIQQKRRRGQGQSFHQLREYQDGDPLKQMDWKATARHRKLISREYQDERDQQIVFMLDCSRRMRSIDQGINHFDQALNAMLLLTYVALRQEDAVGFYTFGGVERWFAPVKHQSKISHILNQVYDLSSTTEPADYLKAAEHLSGLLKKRALVILLTNARDEDYQDLAEASQILSGKHLVMVANLREAILDEQRIKPIQNLDDALLYSAITDYQNRRQQTHQKLVQHGTHLIDTTAGKLPTDLVNGYLGIKRRGVL